MSGEELLRPRARIISRSERPRARLVEVNDFVLLEKTRQISPQDFIKEFRQKVGLLPEKPLTSSDFYKMGQEYPNLIPVLIHNPGLHWVLVREIGMDFVEVYDPIRGLRRINDPDKTKFWFLCPDEEHPNTGYNFIVNISLDKARDERYSLPRQPLVSLGPIQADALNCGPLMIYGALVAKGLIKSP